MHLTAQGERGRAAQTRVVTASDALVAPDPTWLTGDAVLSNEALLPELIDTLVDAVRAAEATHGPLTGCAVVLDDDLQTGYLVCTTAPDLEACGPDGWRLIGRHAASHEAQADIKTDAENAPVDEAPWRQRNRALWLAGLQGARQRVSSGALWALTQHGDSALARHSLAHLNAPSPSLTACLHTLHGAG